jgi:catechol 2,3-dioxygenase-like lactoylglutathione lyase family enzyme
MRQRISMVTIGVSDRARALKFYEALGWEATGETGGLGPDFFQAGDMVVALWDRAELAKDSEIHDDPGGWGGITLAHCVGSREEVDAITEAARAAGATIAREPAETFWGGYDSIVLDPDGNPWEIAHNPHWTLTNDGGVRMA